MAVMRVIALRDNARVDIFDLSCGGWLLRPPRPRLIATAVPLWKVIVGSAGKTYAGPRARRFFCAAFFTCHCEERECATKQSRPDRQTSVARDCFAEFTLGLADGKTRGSQ
jgi:hypothetical protein